MRAKPVSHSLLGILSLRPMSGYDIRKFVCEHIGYFWRESYGQIYPVLQRMASDGLVKVRTEQNQGKPDRQVYSLTAAGRAELEKWLATQPLAPSPRNELLLKLFFGARGKRADMVRHVEMFSRRHEHLLQQYDQVEQWLRRNHLHHPDFPFWMMTLDYGRRNSTNLREWAAATVRTLQHLPARQNRVISKTGNRKKKGR